jgi:hypothetical protein
MQIITSFLNTRLLGLILAVLALLPFSFSFPRTDSGPTRVSLATDLVASPTNDLRLGIGLVRGIDAINGFSDYALTHSSHLLHEVIVGGSDVGGGGGVYDGRLDNLGSGRSVLDKSLFLSTQTLGLFEIRILINVLGDTIITGRKTEGNSC